MTKSAKRTRAKGTADDPTRARLVVLSRFQVTRYLGEAPYVVVSIRSPRDPIARLKSDPLRVARINLAFCDTTPEWEQANSEPLPVMTAADAQRIVQFLARYWARCVVVVHCKFGSSRSAGVAAGILDAFSLDAKAYESDPYEPNPHVRQLMRDALAPYVASGRLRPPD